MSNQLEIDFQISKAHDWRGDWTRDHETKSYVVWKIAIRCDSCGLTHSEKMRTTSRRKAPPIRKILNCISRQTALFKASCPGKPPQWINESTYVVENQRIE